MMKVTSSHHGIKKLETISFHCLTTKETFKAN